MSISTALFKLIFCTLLVLLGLGFLIIGIIRKNLDYATFGICLMIYSDVLFNQYLMLKGN